MFIAFGVLFVVLYGVSLYGLWQPAVRITHVEVYGADQAVAAEAKEAMQGTYLGIPRDSIFFVPESTIRSVIMSAHRDIAAVSIFRDGLNTISIKVDYRVPVARWCGNAPMPAVASSSPGTAASPTCYFFDANGAVYDTTNPQPLVNAFTIYEPLESESTTSSDMLSPVGDTLPNAADFPTVFDFARQLAGFGSSVTQIAFGSDNEVDVLLASGSKIEYSLGDEQNAFTALTSARSNFNLADGSVDYIDLRFPGKVYVKKNVSLKK